MWGIVCNSWFFLSAGSVGRCRGTRALSGNRALELVALVLIRLTRLHQIDRLSDAVRRKVADEVPRTHQGIAAAIIEGDSELARHRLRRHLEVLAKYLR